jgi:pimeloyl-ACP methyl ester carboxylesterase
MVPLVVVAMSVAAMWATGANATSNPVSTPPSIVDAPVQVAHTTLGKVTYREVGHGPALLLIMGYAGTMQTWDPHFVDVLALHYRVIIFNNAGIDGTATLPSPLTIDKMADQTGALISSLHLKDANVLGWSMGSMIAQALAILHPSQVSRLVLLATFSGLGNAVQPSQKAVNALTSGNAAAAQADLFPANQTMAADAFDGSIAAFTPAPSTSATVIAAQKAAILAWFDGKDPTGHHADQISVPTLIADGAHDHIDAAVNDRDVASQIPGSQLVMYPDAGHAFLFQIGETFIFKVRVFLSGMPMPVTLSQLRQGYLANYKLSNAAGTAWVAGLKKLTSKSSAQDLARLDLRLADAEGTFDDELLGYGASGSLGKSVSAIVNADELVVRDLLAFGAQSGPQAKQWAATIKSDGNVVLAAEDSLRHQLGLAPIKVPTSTTTTTTTTTKATTTTTFTNF